MNKYNNKNKVIFIWVIVTLIITASMAFASIGHATTVRDVNKQQDLEQKQQELDFPVLESWPAGNGEDAVWVDPRQSMNPIGMDGLEFDTPKYKTNLNSEQPIHKLTDPGRANKVVSHIELFGWN